LTKRIKIGTAVVTLPLANPLRVVENTAFVDILSNGRFALGLGSGYRKYEFDGFGVDFDSRRDLQGGGAAAGAGAVAAEAHRSPRQAFWFQGRRRLRSVSTRGARAASADLSSRRDRALDRNCGTHGARPFSIELDTVRRTRAAERALPRAAGGDAAELARQSGAGHVDVARWVYVAETDATAKSDSEAGIMRNLAHFGSGHASGYLGTVGATIRDYDTLTRDIILHGSPATVIGKIEELQAKAHNASLMLHFPPWYGADKALASLEMFAAEVMPKFRQETRAQKSA
jgi:alkanesulfonate monooxygenase SsuD/methylene tetrahydromethanopterin reductase-like flavin-dependent oxidoreductase (luciferase family)